MKTYKRFIEESSNSYRSEPIEGGTGKGKIFGSKDTTVDDHLSAMQYHLDEYQKEDRMTKLVTPNARIQDQTAKQLHHGNMYHKHKEQIEAIEDIGNIHKN